jgi:Tfp pilus assembly protein PilF
MVSLQGIQARPQRAAILFTLLIAFAAYGNSLLNGFVLDDAFQIESNPWIRDIRNLPAFFTTNVWAFEGIQTSNFYRPLVFMIYTLVYQVFGQTPWAFHLVNILFHAGVSIVVFLIAVPLFKSGAAAPSVRGLAPAFTAAVLFAVHPVHTEAVTWIAGLADVSCTFFALLSLYLYMQSSPEQPAFNARLASSAALFFLALLSKETALVLPFLVVLYDTAFRRSRNVPLRAFLPRYVPYVIATGVYLILRFLALGGMAPLRNHSELTVGQYAINVLPLFSQYLQMLLFPVNLNFFHVFHPLSSLLETGGIISLIVVAAFTACLVAEWKKNRLLFFSLALIAVPLLPVLYIPGVGPNPLAERYLYLPSFGYVLLLGVGFDRAWGQTRIPKPFAAVLFALLAALFLAGTVERNLTWRDYDSIFADTRRKSPEASGHHAALGQLLLQKGKIDEAIVHLQVAQSFDNRNAAVYHDLARAFQAKGWIDQALVRYQIAVMLNPADADFHKNFGNALSRQGRIHEALEQYRTALALRPDDADGQNTLGLVLMGTGRIDESIAHFKRAMQLSPGLIDSYNNLGVVYAQKGQMKQAIEYFEKAVRLNPANEVSRSNLNSAYQQLQAGKKARNSLQEKLPPP